MCFEGVLKDLGEVDAVLHGFGIEPCRECDGAFDRFIDGCHADGRHIDIDHHWVLVFLQLKISDMTWLWDWVSIFFKADHDEAE